mmetsp:Transcript_15428/g.38872  ORF Transcript_15428/g.38872 Transcript_15428/m.38872 type:complete len:220 (-) Transcript_15428:1772-2431(-)
MISEAFFATSVPERPIDRPTSAAFRAGPSFVPSPVTPTTSPTPSRDKAHSALYPGKSKSFSVAKSLPGCCSSHSSSVSGRRPPLSRWTRVCLSSGLERARTCSFGRMASSFAGVNFLNSSPVIAMPPSVKIPACLAIALAVSMLSPVTMRTKIPALWHTAMASTTSSRSGSAIPTSASKHISFSSFSSHTSTVIVEMSFVIFSILLRWVIAMHRKASCA